MVREVSSLTELDSLAVVLVSILEPVARARGCIVALKGPLGAGKTSFVRLLAHHLGVDEADVASPTFVLAHEYMGRANLLIEHWDLFRLGGAPAELKEQVRPGMMRLVEWFDRAEEELAPPDLVIELAFPEDCGEQDERRLVEFSGELSKMF